MRSNPWVVQLPTHRGAFRELRDAVLFSAHYRVPIHRSTGQRVSVRGVPDGAGGLLLIARWAK